MARPARQLVFRIKPAKGGQYRVQIVGKNGEVLYTSESLFNKRDAVKTVNSVSGDILVGRFRIEFVDSAGKVVDPIEVFPEEDRPKRK